MAGMEEKNIYQELAEKIQKVLDEKKIRPSDLAKELGVSPSYITQFLKYGNKTPAERIQQILDILGYELTISGKKTLSIGDRRKVPAGARVL